MNKNAYNCSQKPFFIVKNKRKSKKCAKKIILQSKKENEKRLETAKKYFFIQILTKNEKKRGKIHSKLT